LAPGNDFLLPARVCALLIFGVEAFDRGEFDRHAGDVAASEHPDWRRRNNFARRAGAEVVAVEKA
jgi:hypothetical protein